MSTMFQGATEFNGYISSWDIGGVQICLSCFKEQLILIIIF